MGRMVISCDKIITHEKSKSDRVKSEYASRYKTEVWSKSTKAKILF